VAFMLFASLLILGVFGRVFLQYRTTGNHGVRPATKNSPPLQKLASFLLVASALIMFIYTLGEVLGFFDALYNTEGSLLVFGYFLYSVGLSITLLAQHQMGTAWRIGVDPTEKTSLITNGLYRYVRNPIYTGLFLGGVGLFLISPSIILLVGMLAFFVSVELFVKRVEEPYLREQFGEVFRSWYQSTGRYFPKLGSKLVDHKSINDHTKKP